MGAGTGEYFWNMEYGNCKLCHEWKPLLTTSHIMSKFIFKDLFDPKKRLTMFSAKARMEGKGRVKAPPSAPYTSGILCSDCDNRILSGYETYARDLLFGKQLRPNRSPHVLTNRDPRTGYQEMKVSNIDYAKAKLFFLSMLWRAHHSDQEFFKTIALGPYEETLRKALLDGQAPREREFPVVCFSWRRTSRLPADIVAEPRSMRLRGHRGYNFMFQGLVVMIYVSPLADAAALDSNLLREDGTLVVFEAEPSTGPRLLFHIGLPVRSSKHT